MASSALEGTTSSKKFPCGSCNRKFNKQSNLTRHRRSVHQETIAKGRSAQRCPLCDFEYMARAAYVRHLGDVHDTWLTEEKHEFESLEAFFVWKGEVERLTISSFVRNTAKKNTKDGVKTYYICCRKGYYRSAGKGMKLIKQQGSRKINSSCPAAMTVLETPSDRATSTVRVGFVSTHVGHDNELAHLDLSKSEREQVAHQISIGFSPERILRNFRQGAAAKETERIRLLNKRDIHNIARDFKLDIRKHEVDLSALESWAGQLEQGEHSPLLLYKPQGTVDGRHEELRDDDFVLGLMNDTQEALLIRNCRRLVCLDQIECGSGTGIARLVTVHLLAEHDDEFAVERPRALPVALMVTGRLDRAVMVTFLRCLRQRVGYVSTEVLVSGGDEEMKGEDEDFFHDAWREIMGTPQLRWMCSWHVAANWEGHMKGMPKDVARNARRKMEALVRERDKHTFETLLPKTLEDLANCRVTTDFSCYLDTHWSPLVRRWAHCYRSDTFSGNAAGVALSLEQMRKELRLRFRGDTTGGGGGRRSSPPARDEALVAVFGYVREALLGCASGGDDNQIMSHIAPLLEQLHSACTARHSLCEEYAADSRLRLSRGAGDPVWLVEEQQDAATSWQGYQVKFAAVEETECNCHLSCPKCHACVHTFACTCLDYVVCFNVCLHIHAVAMAIGQLDDNHASSQQQSPTPADSKTEAVVEMYVDVEGATSFDVTTTEIGEVVTIKEVEDTRPPDAASSAGEEAEKFFQLQAEVVTSMNELLEVCETLPQLEALRRMLEPVRPALAVLKSSGASVVSRDAELSEEQTESYVAAVGEEN